MAQPIVIILAAGMGTRMKSQLPKVLHAIAGRSLIAWVIEAARGAGAQQIVAVLGHKLADVRGALDDRYGVGTIAVAEQAEQRGTGHAVQSALPQLASAHDDQIVVILSGDAPLITSASIERLVAACQASPAGMALLSTIPDRDMPYGRLVRDAQGNLASIVEHLDATPAQREIRETNAGFYAVRLGHLRADLQTLGDQNKKGEVYLTDLVAKAAARGFATAIDAPFAEVSGINDRVDLAQVERLARRQIAERWMREGTTLQDPAQIYIDADVVAIGADTWLGCGVALRGKTTLGRGVKIDCGAILTDAVIGDGTVVKPYSVITETTVGQNAQIGPFSHCRPGTEIDDRVHLGNFVETKKAQIMAGAKANHLAYLGDVFIGADANVGAGVITCNYDGYSKNKTTIESGVFVGSDSQLVAPVTVGRGAYVGSGTTVTKDVPRGALALSRTQQVNVDGWADKYREAQAKRKARNNT
ncbi:MAG: bifunctional UDP-N-acetylglucosamine diphosphorylase/glucosamine-1-phosphate N-acetyltransferase GlmU [Myxococcales bacterium]|nr:bifunctional UDP-N-acetylglucosamine diphosphorylase/glucosamine-1-phosphate N-acetyltransferase GlmU [Myxococcales bacterium]